MMDTPLQAHDLLSGRELEVLKLLAQGCTNQEIALSLGIKERTVRFHVENILAKLGVNNRTQAVSFAFRKGWIQN